MAADTHSVEAADSYPAVSVADSCPAVSAVDSRRRETGVAGSRRPGAVGSHPVAAVVGSHPAVGNHPVAVVADSHLAVGNHPVAVADCSPTVGAVDLSLALPDYCCGGSGCGLSADCSIGTHIVDMILSAMVCRLASHKGNRKPI